MGLARRLADAVRGRRAVRQVSQESTASRYWTRSLLSNYENMFAQIRPLVDEMKIVRPYGVGRNGATLPLSRTPELARLFEPNDRMGWLDFADAMFVSWLTEPALYIHVHKSENGRNVLGYSILPSDSRKVLGGNEYWEITLRDGTVEKFTRDEVMTLVYSRNPLNLDNGVSPSSSVYIWAQIDDLLAQYQRAFLENGAVPATITFITASTFEKYENKRKELETGLKGARNRNKTIFAWRQMLDDGTTGDELEVKTIQGPNSTLAIKDIISIVNDRLNKSVGVSNFIMGDDSSAKYDNAELSDNQFTRRRVYPALMSFWSSFQHELDRITGGLGYAIDFYLEIPDLTDRIKTKAETSSIVSSTLIKLLESGATPSTAVQALGLPRDKWLPVADAIYAQKQKEQALGEVAGAIAEAVKTGADAIAAARSTLKALPQASATRDELPTFSTQETTEKKTFEALRKLRARLVVEEPLTDEQLQEWIAETTEDITEAVKEKTASGASLAIAAALANKASLGDYAKVLEEQSKAGTNSLGDEFYGSLDERIRGIVEKFSTDIRDEVAKALTEYKNNAITRAELRERLANIMPEGRAEMIARNEAHYAENAGRLAEDKAIAEHTGAKITLVWHARHDKNTCAVCAAMDGKAVAVGEAFPDHEWTDDGAEVAWDASIYNDYGQVPNAHVNCRCWFEEEYGGEL